MGRRLPRAALEEVRAKLAQESARLMIEHGIRDYRLAKRKAADRLAVSGLAALPSNTQIEACLLERQRLFQPDVHASHDAIRWRCVCTQSAFDGCCVSAGPRSSASDA